MKGFRKGSERVPKGFRKGSERVPKGVPKGFKRFKRFKRFKEFQGFKEGAWQLLPYLHRRLENPFTVAAADLEP